jgi:hypothetical protein
MARPSCSRTGRIDPRWPFLMARSTSRIGREANIPVKTRRRGRKAQLSSSAPRRDKHPAAALRERCHEIVERPPEYNFAPPPLVSAIDYFSQKWGYKPVSLVSMRHLGRGWRPDRRCECSKGCSPAGVGQIVEIWFVPQPSMSRLPKPCLMSLRNEPALLAVFRSCPQAKVGGPTAPRLR